MTSKDRLTSQKSLHVSPLMQNASYYNMIGSNSIIENKISVCRKASQALPKLIPGTASQWALCQVLASSASLIYGAVRHLLTSLFCKINPGLCKIFFCCRA